MTTIGLSIESARLTRDDYRVNLIVLCMWSIVGLAFTGLSLALGIGVEAGQALAAAG